MRFFSSSHICDPLRLSLRGSVLSLGVIWSNNLTLILFWSIISHGLMSTSFTSARFTVSACWYLLHLLRCRHGLTTQHLLIDRLFKGSSFSALSLSALLPFPSFAQHNFIYSLQHYRSAIWDTQHRHAVFFLWRCHSLTTQCLSIADAFSEFAAFFSQLFPWLLTA